MTTIADRTTPDLTAEIKASGTKHYENNSEIPNATHSTHWSKMQVAPPPSPPANLQEMSASELRAMHGRRATSRIIEPADACQTNPPSHTRQPAARNIQTI